MTVSWAEHSVTTSEEESSSDSSLKMSSSLDMRSISADALTSPIASARERGSSWPNVYDDAVTAGSYLPLFLEYSVVE